MGYAQLFQGILMFPDKAAFGEALKVIENGEEAEDDADEREFFRQSLVGDRILVLHYDTYQPASMWFETKGRLYVLANHAVRGYLVAAYFGDGIDLEMIGATPGVISSEFPTTALAVEPAEDFFPVYPNARYDYETRFEGDVSALWWTVREEARASMGAFFSFPIEGSSSSFNDYWSGDQFLTLGNRLYVPGTHESEGPLESLGMEELQLVADANSPVGTAWMAHLPGTESMRIFKHLGFEDVATPNDFYSSCLKLQLNERMLNTWKEGYSMEGGNASTFTDHTSYMYFAKGVGLVKIGYPDGEIVLKEFHRDAETAPPPPRRPTQEMNQSGRAYTPKVTSVKAIPGKKPWWKFW